METVAEAWFRRVWNELETDAIDELFAPDGEAYGIYGQVIRGPSEFRQFHEAFRSVFDEIRIDVADEVACGDRVAIRCEASMIHRGSGQRVPMAGTVFFDLRDGRIHRARNHWDFLSLLESMNLMPARSFDLAVAGRLQPHPQAREAHSGPGRRRNDSSFRCNRHSSG